MKLTCITGIFTLVGLTLVSPSSASISPVWMKSESTPVNPFTGENVYYTLTQTAIHNAGQIAWNGCAAVTSSQGEPYCPRSAAEAEEVYSNLLAEHFLPLSVASGLFVESEVDNIVNFALGAKAQGNNVPTTIDHTKVTINDVYKCGPNEWGSMSIKQWPQFTAGPGWADNTAPNTKKCLNLGGHQGYGDTFAPMTMKNMACSDSMYLICRDSQQSGTSHSGAVTVVNKDMTTTNVDIVRAAFDFKYKPVAIMDDEIVVTDAPGAETNNILRNIGISVLVIVSLLLVCCFLSICTNSLTRSRSFDSDF